MSLDYFQIRWWCCSYQNDAYHGMIVCFLQENQIFECTFRACNYILTSDMFLYFWFDKIMKSHCLMILKYTYLLSFKLIWLVIYLKPSSEPNYAILFVFPLLSWQVLAKGCPKQDSNWRSWNLHFILLLFLKVFVHFCQLFETFKKWKIKQCSSPGHFNALE